MDYFVFYCSKLLLFYPLAFTWVGEANNGPELTTKAVSAVPILTDNRKNKQQNSAYSPFETPGKWLYSSQLQDIDITISKTKNLVPLTGLQ